MRSRPITRHFDEPCRTQVRIPCPSQPSGYLQTCKKLPVALDRLRLIVFSVVRAVEPGRGRFLENKAALALVAAARPTPRTSYCRHIARSPFLWQASGHLNKPLSDSSCEILPCRCNESVRKRCADAMEEEAESDRKADTHNDKAETRLPVWTRLPVAENGRRERRTKRCKNLERVETMWKRSN